MKKSYTVKEVVKMQEKSYDLMHIKNAYEKNHFLPFMALFLCGAGILIKADPSLCSLIVGGASSLLGGAKVLSMMTAETREQWLDDKLEDIYKLMGPEFREQVQEARKTR